MALLLGDASRSAAQATDSYGVRDQCRVQRARGDPLWGHGRSARERCDKPAGKHESTTSCGHPIPRWFRLTVSGLDLNALTKADHVVPAFPGEIVGMICRRFRR